MKGLSVIGIGTLIITSFLPQAASADSVSDLYFQQVVQRYFELPQNARTFGMAGSSVQTSTDSSSILGNPAGIGFMEGGEVSGSYGHSRISGTEFPKGADVNQTSNAGSAMIAMPIGPRPDATPLYGNFGLAWSQMDAKWNHDSFDTIAETTRVTGNYAYAFSDTFSAGYSITWVDDKFQSREIFDYPMADGLRHSLGGLWRSSPDLAFGSSFFIGDGEHHALYGPGIRESSSTFEAGIDAGMSYQFRPATSLAVGVGYRHLSSDGDVVSSIPANVVGGNENGNLFDARVGLEHQLNHWSVLRAGYRYAGLANYKYNRVELNDLNGSANYNAWTLGAGIIFPVSSAYITSIKLDYGVEYRDISHDEWEHLVTISIPFTVCS